MAAPGQMPHVVVVTGASSGVGRAIARRFAEDGVSIGLLARGREGLDGAVFDVEERGGKALAIPIDVSDPRQVDDAASQVEERLGEIDVWINNAMTTVFAYFEDTDPDEFRRATEVTYLGTVWGTRSALARMVPRDRGVIIQVGSALAYRGIPLQAAYCGAKHAMKGFTESVRTELLDGDSSVHLGMVQLPAVNTPQFSHCRSRFDRHPMPVPPIYEPEVAAEAVHLAVRERRREIYVGLPTVLTIVGNKVSSAYVDRHLARKGVSSQLSDLPPSPDNREGNLFAPVEGDPGPRGIFTVRSRSFSPVLWISEHRRSLLAGAATALLGAWWARR